MGYRTLPDGAGVTDHAALENLAFAAAGHTGFEPSGAAAAVASALVEHATDVANPHGVTAEQAGAAPAGHNHHSVYAPVSHTHPESDVINLMSDLGVQYERTEEAILQAWLNEYGRDNWPEAYIFYVGSLYLLLAIPDGLTSLHCPGNDLDSLPTLPASLIEMNCSENYLTVLPALPDGLTVLYCYQNQIATLPAFPASLLEVNVSGNQLFAIPTLPEGLGYLDAGGNHLSVAVVDSLLQQLDDNGQTDGFADLGWQNPPAIPTNTTAIANLTAKGWTIYVDA